MQDGQVRRGDLQWWLQLEGGETGARSDEGRYESSKKVSRER